MTRGAIALVLAAACSTPAIVEVPTGPGTTYPCGGSGVVCEDGLCCPGGFTCGGGEHSVGCPADMCCFVEATPGVGFTRHVVPKRPQK